jgi:hypothetical protein
MNAVFLSAGIPDQPERGPYLDVSDPVAIRDAVRALAGTALTLGYELVFGGHPAISPLVWQVAQSLDKLPAVVIYQSREFEHVIPPEARRIPNLVWTEHGVDRKHSLHLMRERMLDSHRFALGVFIGGMDGVETEFDLFRRAHPGAPVIPVFTTGGAAKFLWERADAGISTAFYDRLHETRHYQSLFREVLAHVEAT